MSLKTIEAFCVTSQSEKRQVIHFDDATGLIVDVKDPSAEKADFVFGDDCLLFAGMGDVHIHAREDVSGKNNYKEDFLSAQSALQNGGLVHAGDMPNNPIPPVDEASYEAKVQLMEKAHGDLWAYAGIGPKTRPLSYTVPYKVYMGPSIGDLFFKDFATLDETLKHYENQHVSFHCEDPEILDEYKDRPHHHLKRPVSAESVATKDALTLIEKYHLKGKLCHYSTDSGLQLVRAARSRGVKVSLEVTPQHLYFDMDHLSEKDWKRFQMNPPIRSVHDREALKEALKNGEIEYLATDHAPHTHEEKEKGTSGLTGLDTYGPFVTWLLCEGVSPSTIAKITAENPGDFHNTFLPSWKKISKVYENFGKGVGYLLPGFRANFTILNLRKPLLVSKENLKTKVGHSPFEGVTFPGQVEALFIGGRKE